jgi:hypothetical protein
MVASLVNCWVIVAFRSAKEHFSLFLFNQHEKSTFRGAKGDSVRTVYSRFVKMIAPEGSAQGTRILPTVRRIISGARENEVWANRGNRGKQKMDNRQDLQN